MTTRFYILPLVSPNGVRTPKYIYSPRYNPEGTVTVPTWSLKDYGSIDQCVFCGDIDATNHNLLSANSDVLSIPVNIDSTLNAGAVSAAKTFLENYNIPAGWINAGVTYREVLRTVTAFFLYLQRVVAILGHPINFPPNWLNIQFGNLSSEIQGAMIQAAQEQGFDTSPVQSTTTIRAILKYMADAWGNTPIHFGFASL